MKAIHSTIFRIFSFCLLVSLSFSVSAQKKVAPRQYKFTAPKSAKEARKEEEMSAKNVNVKKIHDVEEEQEAMEEEEGGAQKKVIRRVGVVSNVPKNGNIKMGGTKNPSYNPHLNDAVKKAGNGNTNTSTSPTKSGLKPQPSTTTSASPSTRMKPAPSVSSGKK